MLLHRFAASQSLILSLIFVAATCSLAAAIDAEQLDKAQALIDRAEKLSSLAQPQSGPFFFEARIDHTPSKVTGKGGIYKIWWAAPDRWREEAEADGVTAFQIRNEQGLWTAPEFNPTLDGIFAGGRGFPFRGKLLEWDEKITGLKEHKVDGVPVSCVEVEKNGEQRELCFDGKSGLLIKTSALVKVHTSSQLRTFDPILIEVEYRDYAGLGNKAVPSEIRRLTRGEVTGVLRLISVSTEPKTPFLTALFDAPAGYQLWPACDHYVAAGIGAEYWRELPGMFRPFRLNGPQHYADGVRIVVAPTGKAQQVQLVEPIGQPSKKIISEFMNLPYEPATCDGKPVMGSLFILFPTLFPLAYAGR